MVIGNVGDDFRHFGLHISPDIDTLLYTLSGKSDQEKGWGLANETWQFMSAIKDLGGDTWFQLGDRDLATHVERTCRLQNGESLSEITDYFRRTFGIGATIIPATDDQLRTIVETDIGVLNFQEYFVRERCNPRIQNLHFQGSESAFPQQELTKALRNKKLQSIIFCPSNPLLSIDPILSIQGLKRAFADSGSKNSSSHTYCWWSCDQRTCRKKFERAWLSSFCNYRCKALPRIDSWICTRQKRSRRD